MSILAQPARARAGRSATPRLHRRRPLARPLLAGGPAVPRRDQRRRAEPRRLRRGGGGRAPRRRVPRTEDRRRLRRRRAARSSATPRRIRRRGRFAHLETGAPIGTVAGSLTTANAYLGAAPLVEALAAGADLVITGRVADPSLTVAPCVHHFGWRPDDWDRLAGATVAGHLIECGTQVTGGISTDWLDLPTIRDIGYPIVEVAADGSCVVTKPAGTGGPGRRADGQGTTALRDRRPGNYLSPDCTVSFLTLRVEDLGGDRVRVSGATGRPPPRTYKVSATYPAGYRASGHADDRRPRRGRQGAGGAARSSCDACSEAGAAPERSLVECLGAGDATGGILRDRDGAADGSRPADHRRRPAARGGRAVHAGDGPAGDQRPAGHDRLLRRPARRCARSSPTGRR